MVGMRTSVKTLLSRLWREREGRRAWLGVGVVGVQKLFLLAYRVPGVGYDLKMILLLKSNTPDWFTYRLFGRSELGGLKS